MVLQVTPPSLPVIPPSSQTPLVSWDLLPDDYVLPDDPVETIQQPFLAAALTDALSTAQRLQPTMLVASNFGLVASVNRTIVVKAPDWVFVPQVNPVPEQVVRRSYTPNAEGGSVALVMEFLSDTETGEYSVRPSFPYGKLYFYERILAVPTYVIFDPSDALLEVRQLQGNRYTLSQPNAEGRYWIPELDLFLGCWQGQRQAITTHWLRWWDAEGNLLLWASEKAEQESQRAEQERQRAEQERQRAEQLAEKLRSHGIDPDAL